MSANTSQAPDGRGTYSLRTGGALPWVAGFLLSLFVILSWIGDPPVQALTLEEAMGSDIEVVTL